MIHTDGRIEWVPIETLRDVRATVGEGGRLLDVCAGSAQIGGGQAQGSNDVQRVYCIYIAYI